MIAWKISRRLWDQTMEDAMSGCDRCGHSGGKHNVACPETMSGVAKVLALKDWQEGYKQGRSSGKAKPAATTNGSYRLGYRYGVSALEEAENEEPFSDTTDFNDDCRDEITEGEND